MNQAKKGKRFSLKTEFKKGTISSKRCPVGTIKTRKRNRGKRRFSKWIKIENPNKWILFCRYVLEKHCGAIPKGFLVHHKDRNTLNTNIANLELMCCARHLLEHKSEFEKKRIEKLSLALQKQ